MLTLFLVKMSKEIITLSTDQREEVLTKIADERHFLFGKIKEGIPKNVRDEYRKNFMAWCVKRTIPYPNWKKVESQFNLWKQTYTKNQDKRKNKTGDKATELAQWEKLMADCEPEDPKYNPNKEKVIFFSLIF